jgi:hypothetical protein
MFPHAKILHCPKGPLLRGVVRQCGRWLLPALLSCLLANAVLARESTAGLPAAIPDFKRLALAIGKQTDTMRADFAVTAITELALAHTGEADRARREAPHNRHDNDLLRWARTVDAYAAELSAIAASITPATPIDIGISHEDVVYLNVAGRLVMLGNPRVSEQLAYEERVTERFCELHRCEGLVREFRPPRRVSSSRTRTPHWSFSQQSGPACNTEGGLVFQFRDTTDLRLKRDACARIAAELDTLTAVIRQHLAQGTRIEWDRLAIRALPGEELQLLELNGDGAVFRVAAPGLAAATKLFTLVRPWLTARVKGNSYRMVVVNADRLMAPAYRTQPGIP